MHRIVWNAKDEFPNAWAQIDHYNDCVNKAKKFQEQICLAIEQNSPELMPSELELERFFRDKFIAPGTALRDVNENYWAPAVSSIITALADDDITQSTIGSWISVSATA